MNTATRFAVLIAALGACHGACTARTAAPPPIAPKFEDKLSSILRLEDHRVLREVPPPPEPTAGAAPAVAEPADLVRLVADTDVRVRRRAALAIGRTGVRSGVQPLVRALADADAGVRQSAAFALGLLGDPAAEAPLAALLADPDPGVRGAAAEGLGLLGATAQANAIAEMVGECAEAGLLAPIAPDDLTYPMSPQIEACRLGIYALARLKTFEPLARAVLGADGTPIAEWWPIAYALRRVEDPRAGVALRRLLASSGLYTRAFAARGLGVIKAADAVPDLLPIAADVARQPGAAVEAIRALAAIGDRSAAPVLRQVLSVPGLDPGIRAEAALALGATGVPDVDGEFLLDLVSDPAPAVRGNARRALGRLDPERFLLALSGIDEDSHWSVRAATAEALTLIPAELAVPLVHARLDDQDLRVVPALLDALVRLKAPAAGEVALKKLEADDVMVRAAAAAAIGELCPEGSAGALRAAFAFAGRDASAAAREAVLGAAPRCDKAAALELAQAAVRDPDWAVRLRAASLLKELAPDGPDPAAAIRPAPSRWTDAVYASPSVIAPAYATHAYFETDHGTFQIELAMLDAPLTVHNFVTLARAGYFDGLSLHRVVPHFVIQDGDPRGDGTGGPGYSIRDELNRRPYGRGTVGMALAGPDTGGSQYFVTHAPQPHLDGRYTVFGQVVSGMEVVDRLQQWDVIRRVWIWDGTR